MKKVFFFVYIQCIFVGHNRGLGEEDSQLCEKTVDLRQKQNLKDLVRSFALSSSPQ